MDRPDFDINWDAFHFLRPDFLWLLLPLAAALLVGLIGIREEVKWKKHIAPHLRPFMIRKGSEAFKRWMQVVAFLVISMGILGLAGPTWKQIDLPERILETPLVIALDLSQSMMASDLQPTRLERAKFKIQDLLRANPRARTALIGFAGTAHTLVPLTGDYNIIESHLSTLSPDVLPFQGTDQQAAILLADSLAAATRAPGTLLLITDAFNEETFGLLQQYNQEGGMRVEVMPMGTSAGARVPQGKTNRPMKDANGKYVVSSIDREIVSRINALEKVHVIDLTLDDSDMEQLAATVRENLEFREAEENTEENWKDEGFWLVVPFALFLLFWFRKGWVIYTVPLLLLFSSCSGEGSLKKLWFTPDYQGQLLYEQGDFEGAATLFADPMRRGLAYYKAGDYAQAIEAFSADSSAQGQYNLGLSYYKAGNLGLAREAFERAAVLDPDMQAATTNLSRTEDLIESSLEFLQEAEEAPGEERAENTRNSGPEDLSGGGQEATEEDMKQERQEETVNTDIRKGKELDEVPEDFTSGQVENSQKVLMRKVDDDPSLFIKRKLAQQVRARNIKPRKTTGKW